MSTEKPEAGGSWELRAALLKISRDELQSVRRTRTVIRAIREPDSVVQSLAPACRLGALCCDLI